MPFSAMLCSLCKANKIKKLLKLIFVTNFRKSDFENTKVQAGIALIINQQSCTSLLNLVVITDLLSKNCFLYNFFQSIVKADGEKDGTDIKYCLIRMTVSLTL